MLMLGVFTFSASGCPPLGNPTLPSSFETLPVPLAAEAQGAELTSKLKQTPAVAQIPSIDCHVCCVRTVEVAPCSVMHSISSLITRT